MKAAVLLIYVITGSDTFFDDGKIDMQMQTAQTGYTWDECMAIAIDNNHDMSLEEGVVYMACAPNLSAMRTNEL